MGTGCEKFTPHGKLRRNATDLQNAQQVGHDQDGEYVPPVDSPGVNHRSHAALQYLPGTVKIVLPVSSIKQTDYPATSQSAPASVRRDGRARQIHHQAPILKIGVAFQTVFGMEQENFHDLVRSMVCRIGNCSFKSPGPNLGEFHDRCPEMRACRELPEGIEDEV